MGRVLVGATGREQWQMFTPDSSSNCPIVAAVA